jgi:hypothetical protein
LNQTVAFISFAAGWSVVCSLFLGSVHPIALFAVWLVGFVWGAGYISAGTHLADLLTKRWLQMMLGLAVVGGLIALFVN